MNPIRPVSPIGHVCYWPHCIVRVSRPREYCSTHQQAAAAAKVPPAHALVLTRADLIPESQHKPHSEITIHDFEMSAFSRVLGSDCDEIIFRDSLAEMETKLNPTP